MVTVPVILIQIRRETYECNVALIQAGFKPGIDYLLSNSVDGGMDVHIIPNEPQLLVTGARSIQVLEHDSFTRFMKEKNPKLRTCLFSNLRPKSELYDKVIRRSSPTDFDELISEIRQFLLNISPF